MHTLYTQMPRENPNRKWLLWAKSNHFSKPRGDPAQWCLSNFSSPRAALIFSLFIYLFRWPQVTSGSGSRGFWPALSSGLWVSSPLCAHQNHQGAYPDPTPKRPGHGSRSSSGDSDLQSALRTPRLDKESKAQRGQVTCPRSHSKPGGDPGIRIFTHAAPIHSPLALQSCLFPLLLIQFHASFVTSTFRVFK